MQIVYSRPFANAFGRLPLATAAVYMSRHTSVNESDSAKMTTTGRVHGLPSLPALLLKINNSFASNELWLELSYWHSCCFLRARPSQSATK